LLSPTEHFALFNVPLDFAVIETKKIDFLSCLCRLMPVIGQYKISDVARISFLLHEEYGRIVRLGGLMGRPDLLFVYDADEIEKVSRKQN
jgi:hypothetical protein